MATFRYDPELLVEFPAVVGGVILAGNLTNGPGPEGLAAAYRAEQQATLARIGTTPLSQIEALSAWRQAFRQFGVDPTQYRSAAEALLRRLTKKGDIPGINLLVDLGNLISIRYALPVAVFDTRALQGAVTVRFAAGSERYTPLGQSESIHPDSGEVIFADESGLVIARRWCWRQSNESAAGAATTEAIITVEAHHPTGRADVEAALNDLLQLLNENTDGSFTSAVLDASNPTLSD